MAGELSDEQFRAIYAWIDAIPLSRPKKNIARDFSDGVMLAEVIAAYFPQMVELHNYAPASSLKQKVYNFDTLNKRVLKKLGYVIPKPLIEDVATAKPGAVEFVLNAVQIKMAKYRERKVSGEGHSGGSQSGGNNAQHQDGRSVAQRNSGGGENRDAGGNRNKDVGAVIDEEILMEKEQQIRELQETVEILELKVAKLEQLVRLKDNKIQKLLNNK